MTPLELSASDATIWSVALESSGNSLKVSFTLVCNVHRTGVSYDYRNDRKLFIVQATDLSYS